MSDTRTKKLTYSRYNTDTGITEEICKITGEVVSYSAEPGSVIEENPEAFIEVNLDGKAVLMQKGMDPNIINKFGKRKTWKYNDIFLDVICNLIADGMDLWDVCKMEDMPPYYMVRRWRKSNPEFDKAIDDAEREQARIYFHRAVKMAEGVETKDDVAINQFKHSVYKYAAQINKPEKYSPQRNVNAKVDVAQSIVIDTGIRRVNDPGYIADETKKIVERQAAELLDASEKITDNPEEVVVENISEEA